ncbi:hypothetical protein NDU88_004921 [Pleurodeles waltl]|uniref:Uncharacterized protein n=1 Tax=Pleurodeles waltl TaxID=8319 RepID=A0AAV7RH30_PLEWA|nr:hypothetical protein NDU88_004921 [Pleurodeles waltl]
MDQRPEVQIGGQLVTASSYETGPRLWRCCRERVRWKRWPQERGAEAEVSAGDPGGGAVGTLPKRKRRRTWRTDVATRLDLAKSPNRWPDGAQTLGAEQGPFRRLMS